MTSDIPEEIVANLNAPSNPFESLKSWPLEAITISLLHERIMRPFMLPRPSCCQKGWN